jgi:hypothetical protein
LAVVAGFAGADGFAADLVTDAGAAFFFDGAAAADLLIGVLDFDFNDTDLEAAFLGVSLLFFVIAFSTPSAVTFVAAIDNESSSRWQAAATMKRARDACLLR